MDWMKLLEILVWPITILILVFIFRKPIEAKLRALIKVKDLVEFSPIHDMAKINDNLTKNQRFAVINKNNFSWDDYLDALESWAAYAGTISMFLNTLKITGKLTFHESDEATLKYALKDFNTVLKKIRKDRSQSEYLSLLKQFESVLQMRQHKI